MPFASFQILGHSGFTTAMVDSLAKDLMPRFKMFDAHGLSGSVKFETFLEVIEKKSHDSPTSEAQSLLACHFLD